MFSALDHIALVVRDLDAATAQYQALLGKAPSWRGADGGAAHSWFQLANVALDIIAPTGAGHTGDRVLARLETTGEGIWAIALTTANIQKTLHTLARRAVAGSDARSIRSTQVESGDEHYWTTSVLDAASTHGPTIFVVEHTPDEPPDEPPDEHPGPGAALNPAEPAGVSALDHVVVTTTHPNRAAAFYGARLGLEMALDRTSTAWGTRLMFFRCGDLIIEVAHDLSKEPSDDPDQFWGVSWRAPDIDAARARLAGEGFDVSAVRPGRKPGTRVFTVRDRTSNVPTIMIGRDER
jgi:catechol 2,3-dioxygenase-like lactoylglutathione lyase family enzyme